MEQLAILPNTDLTKYISGSILLIKYMYLLFKKISIEQISHPQTLQNNKLKAINVDDFENKILTSGWHSRSNDPPSFLGGNPT